MENVKYMQLHLQYSFDEEIPVGIYPGFKINIAELLM